MGTYAHIRPVRRNEMKTAIKKCLAFMLALGLMGASLTAYASGYSYSKEPGNMNDYYVDDNYNVISSSLDLSAGGYYGETQNGERNNFIGTEPPSSNLVTWPSSDGRPIWFNHYAKDSSGNWVYQGDYYFDGTNWVRDGGAYLWGGAPAVMTEEGIKRAQEMLAAHAEALANQKAARDAGFANIADMYAAAEKNMSAGEYYNNAVTNTPGIENAIPVGQGGNLIVNGVKTNMTATINKVDRSYVDSVRAKTEGTILNVVDVAFPATDATINFYMPGVAEGSAIIAMQYSGNDTWMEVEVTEIRADHVVLNLKQGGIVAFIQQ